MNYRSATLPISTVLRSIQQIYFPPFSLPYRLDPTKLGLYSQMPASSDMQETKHVDLLVHAQWIIPVHPVNTAIANHAIAIHEGNILDVLPSEQAQSKYTGKQTLHLSTHALLPGLINAHGHAAMSLFRGLADDLPLMDWLNDHIWPAEGKWVSEDFVHDGTELAIAEMLRGGTTCYSDMYFFPDVAAKVAEQVGMRAQYVCPVLDFPTVWGSGPDEYLAKALDLAISYADSSLISVGLGPHAPYTVADKPLENIRELSTEYDIPVQIHLHETAHEVEEALKESTERPIARLKRLGLISANIPLQCVHMTALNDQDIADIESSGASVIHCPESNLKLASGFCPTQRLIDAKINVALGTDGAASNNDLDLFGEMRTAALIGKAVANDASAIDARTALEMATINGARALGLDDICGSLEVGKAADMIAVNLASLNTQPSYDPISDIVYSLASNQVDYVWVAGIPQLTNGKLVKLDEQTLIDKAISWSAKISKSDK